MTNEFTIGVGSTILDEFAVNRAAGAKWEVTAKKDGLTKKATVEASWDAEGGLASYTVHGNMGTGSGVKPAFRIAVEDDLVRLYADITEGADWVVRAKRIMI